MDILTPSDPELSRQFRLSANAVIYKFITFGLPKSLLPKELQLSERPKDRTESGFYDDSKERIVVYYPQLRSVIDWPWIIAHEIAHFLWYKKLGDCHKSLWYKELQQTGKPLDRESLKVLSSRQEGPFWHYFQRSKLKSLSDYLHNVNYSPTLPRDYSSTDPKEAWADVVASLVLGKSHVSNLLRNTLSLKKVVIPILKQLESPTIHEYNSLQIDVPEISNKIKDFTCGINPYYMHKIEEDPHITLLTGIEDKHLSKFNKLLALNSSLSFKLGPLKHFESDDCDVLYTSVISRDIQKLRNKLQSLPNRDPHVDYIPHMTIAYLKPGYANKFDGLAPFNGNFTKNTVVISKMNGTKEEIPLSKR